MKAVRLALAFITLLALSTLAEGQTSKPAPGRDENPERIFARAVQSHQSGDIEGAIRDYQAYLALRRLNLLLYRRLPPDLRARPIPHPELGEISIDWILNTLAGHDLHHLRHLEIIAAAGG